MFAHLAEIILCKNKLITPKIELDISKLQILEKNVSISFNKMI